MMLMQIDMKTNKKARYAFYIIGISIIICFSYFIYMNFIASPPAAAVTNQSPSIQKNNEKPPSVFSSSSNIANNISKENPFLELSEVKVINAAKETSGAVASGNEGLPQIPSSFPRPAVGSLPTPSMSGVQNGMSVPQALPKPAFAQATIKGIFMGSADGNNVAIMSDGKIISPGDTYQDNRIMAINGNGIEFADGHGISYK